MAPELSVLVPCFNEEGNLPELVERTERIFDRRGIAGEIILVDDGSQDGTGAEIDALAATHPRVAAVHHATNRGMAAAWKSALDRSRGRYVLTLDADLQYQPEAIAQLYREICFSKADLVQGWRSPLERNKRDIRYVLSRGLDYLLKLAFDMQTHDVKSGFIIYKREVFEEIQLKRLRRLVHHAQGHVGYYRELFESAGITPESVRTLDDLRRIPVLTKQALRENLYFDLLSDNHDKRKIQKIVTSGSTGEPLALFADRFQLDMRWANTRRNVEWTGYRFPDRQVRLWHSTIGLKPRQALKEHLDAFLSRRKFFSVFALDDRALRRYVEYVHRVRPALLDGYAEAFNVIATLLASQPVEGLRAGAIISSAQTLSPETRALVERQFGCRVFDKYGAREFSGIAHECEAHAGHHVT